MVYADEIREMMLEPAREKMVQGRMQGRQGQPVAPGTPRRRAYSAVAAAGVGTRVGRRTVNVEPWP